MADKATENQGNDDSRNLAGFGQLSENDFLDVESADTEKKDPNEEKKDPADEEKKVDSLENKDEDKGDKKDEAPAPNADKKDDKADPEEEGFKTEGATLEDKVEEEAKWVDVAKDFGFELKEDTYESFIEAKNEFIENTKKTAVEEAKLKSFKDEIAELPAESQLLIIGLKNGLTQEQIEAPFKMISEYKALSDADLVAKDLELQGFTPDVVANEIEKMTENDKIEVDAKRLRTILDQNETKLVAV